MMIVHHSLTLHMVYPKISSATGDLVMLKGYSGKGASYDPRSYNK